MAYSTIGFKDGSTPLNATNMNKMDEQIKANADDISTLNTDLGDLIATIDSGSILDIKKSGIYYVRNAVTDKPTNNGGMYILSYYSADYNVGLFISVSPTATPYVQINGTWEYGLSTASYNSLAVPTDAILEED